MIPIEYQDRPGTLPPTVAALIDDARQRVATGLTGHERIPSFVESNYHIAWRALAAVAELGLAPGGRFCEWGSGAGIVTCLAGMAGFQASGIEIEAPLVRIARGLAAAHAPACTFHCASFKPDGAYTDSIDPVALRAGLDPCAFDLVYCYPWKTEERIVFDLFTGYCPPGAILITYHGGGNVRLHRNPPDPDPA